MKIMRWPCQVLFYLPWLNIYPHRITIYKMWDNSTKWIYIYIKIFIFYSLMYNIHTSCKINLIDNHWLTLTTEIFLTIMESPYTRCMMTLPCSLLFTLTIVVSHYNKLILNPLIYKIYISCEFTLISSIEG